MENITTTINSFLPFGESLRNVLQHPSIQKNDINIVLKSKGIFVSDTDDKITFPLLLTNYMSPYEFDILKNRLRSSDDREKIITRTLAWNSSVDLINAIPSDLNLQEIIRARYPKYKIIGNPSFTMIDKDPNHIELVFICESKNYSKAWFRTDNQYTASITIHKEKTNSKLVQWRIVHTSPETMEISNKLVTELTNHFKRSKYINPDSEIKKITFDDFTNEERIIFFMRFTRGNDSLNFIRVLHVDIAPSPEMEMPENMNWLASAKVINLHINGENLHEIDLITNESMRKYIELCEITISYEFNISNIEGNCKIKLGFPRFFKKRILKTEFVVDIESIKLSSECENIQRKKAKKLLLNEFENFKINIYNEIKNNHENK